MFNIDFTFLWTLVNLLILFFVLKKFLFGRVGNFMEARSRRIADERAKAGHEHEEMVRLRVQYEEKLANAEAEAAALLKAARDKAEAAGAAIIAEANEASRLMLINAQTRIEAERAAALLAFKAEAAALVVQASGKLLRRSIDAEESRRLARTLLNESAVGRAGAGVSTQENAGV